MIAHSLNLDMLAIEEKSLVQSKLNRPYPERSADPIQAPLRVGYLSNGLV